MRCPALFSGTLISSFISPLISSVISPSEPIREDDSLVAVIMFQILCHRQRSLSIIIDSGALAGFSFTRHQMITDREFQEDRQMVRHLLVFFQFSFFSQFSTDSYHHFLSPLFIATFFIATFLSPFSLQMMTSELSQLVYIVPTLKIPSSLLFPNFINIRDTFADILRVLLMPSS